MAAHMPSLRELIEKFFVEKDEKWIRELAQGVISRQFAIINVVEELKNELTSVEYEPRSLSVRLLGDVLHRLPRDFLTDKEVEHFCAFFCARLSDHHSILPSTLYGLLALSFVSALSDELCQSIVRNLFKEVHVQSLGQGERCIVYQILENFLAFKLNAVKQLGPDFTYGFIHSMDMEKDPRSLVVCFRIARVIAQHVPLGPFVEELFEVTSCYFPIDFKTPVDNPYGITREDLILALRGVMAATPRFAPYCIPLLLEKLGSDIQSAKFDALQTMSACADVYGAESLFEFADAFWHAAKNEVFHTQSDQVEHAALHALTAVVGALSKNAAMQTPLYSFQQYMATVVKDCEHHLKEPDLKMVWPGAKILQAAAAASPLANRLVFQSVLPLLLEQCLSNRTANQRRTLVEIFVGLFKVTIDNMDATQEHPVRSRQEELRAIFLAALNETPVELRQSALMALNGLFQLTTDSDWVSIAQRMATLSLAEEEPEVRRSLHILLSRFALSGSDQLRACFVEKGQTIIAGLGSSASVTYSLETVAALCCSPQVMKMLLVQLINILPSLSDRALVWKSVNSIVASALNPPDASTLGYLLESILPQLWSICSSEPFTVLEKESDLPMVSLLWSEIVRNAGVDECQKVLRLVTGECLLSGGDSPLWSAVLDPRCPPPKSRVLVVLTAVLGAIEPSVLSFDPARLLRSLLSVAFASDDPVTRESAAKCAASIVNKQASALKTVGELFDSVDSNVNQFAAWLWITKALVVGSSPECDRWISKVLSSLSNPLLASRAAEGFNLILETQPDALNKQCRCHVSLLYQQRFFLTTLQQLKAGFEQSPTELKTYYLRAVSSLLYHVPKSVVKRQLPTFVPMLLHSLTGSENDALWISSLRSLHDLVVETPDVVVNYVDSLLQTWLQLALYERSMKVRIAALQCLAAAATLPPITLLQHVPRVLRGLEPCLDDKKRLVRHEAVAARSEWCLLSTKK